MKVIKIINKRTEKTTRKQKKLLINYRTTKKDTVKN